MSEWKLTEEDWDKFFDNKWYPDAFEKMVIAAQRKLLGWLEERCTEEGHANVAYVRGYGRVVFNRICCSTCMADLRRELGEE